MAQGPGRAAAKESIAAKKYRRRRLDPPYDTVTFFAMP
jgi:hypothetical protein